MPSHLPTLSQFVEDEVARAPLLMEEVLNGLVALQPAPSSADARVLPELQRLVHLYRPDLVARFSRTLDDLLQPARRPDPRLQRVTLSLVENDAVAADVALSHAVDAVRHRAEFELRELRAFVAALVGDRHVSRDHNPLRPELYVKALWAALQTLPAARPMQLAFLRCATPALARGVRLALAAACTRLEDGGLTPARYRTIVTATTTRPSGSPGPSAPADLERLREALPPPPAALIAADGERTAQALLPRIFDSIVQRSGLPADVQALLARVQPVALEVARQDPIALDAYTHPLWAFLDRVAFVAELHPTPDATRERLIAQAAALIDTLTRDEAPDAASFRWALKRLTDALQQRFEERLQKAAGHIATLETLGPAMPPIRAEQGRPLALDATTLDTVRADLLEDARHAPADSRPVALDDPAAAAWIDAQTPGRWARLFVDGRWRPVQLLWHADDLWLYAEVDDEGHAWALRHSALQRLHAEGLLRELRERSLVRRAAARLARDESTPDRR